MLALDGPIFVILAFHGLVSIEILITLIIGQIATKWFSGLVDTPFIYLERYVVESDLKWMNVMNQRLRSISRITQRMSHSRREATA